MRTNNVLLILRLSVLALSGCASNIPPASMPLEIAPPKLAPAPADVMVPREPNFRTRLLLIFSASPPTLMTSPANSPPVSE